MLRFLHIPKTAGATFTNILDGLYPTGRFHFVGNPKNDVPRYHALSPEEKASIQLVTGHAPMVTGIEQIDSMPTICFFRDPVAQVKSYCQHISEGKTPNLLSRFPPEKFSLDEFLWKNVSATTNWQTRVLLGEGFYAPRIEGCFKAAAEEAFQRFMRRGIGIGLTEEFDESLARFAKRFNWKLDGYQKKNVKDPARLLKWETRHIERIEELNQADRELYRLVTAEFKKG